MDEARKLAHAGCDADAAAVRLAVCQARMNRIGKVYLDTIERLVERGIDARRGIAVAHEKGLVRGNDETSLEPVTL